MTIDDSVQLQRGKASFAVAIVALNVAITIPLAYLLNIWQDEAYTLATTARGIGYAFRQAIAFEQNAPLYFVLLTMWRHVGESLFFLRLFSVICVALTVALVPTLVRRYVPDGSASLTALVVACNPFVIWTAVDMRAYGLIVLLSALLLRFYYDAFLADRPSKIATVSYAICVAVALYTQYYMAFLVAGQAVTTLLYYRRLLPRFLLASGAAFVAFLPMVAIVPGQVKNFNDGFTSPSLFHGVLVLANILMRYVLPLPIPHAKVAYFILIAIALAALAWIRPKIEGGRNKAILTTTVVAFALFALGTHALGVHVLERHAAALYVPSVLAVFALLTSLPGAVRERAVVAWSAATIILSAIVLAQSYAARANPGDWARVTAYVQAREVANEPIVVFEAENALPLSYYYHGPNQVVAIPRSVDFDRYDVTRFVIRDGRQLQSVMPSQRRLWLVTAGECASANVRFGCDTLERFIAARYRVQSDATFHGSRVRLLLKQQEAPSDATRKK